MEPGSRWQKDDMIRWVEWRIRGLVAAREQPAWETARRDYEIWLLKERDGLSWPKIAQQCFRTTEESKISKARRAYNRVERHHPGSEQYEPPDFIPSEVEFYLRTGGSLKVPSSKARRIRR